MAVSTRIPGTGQPQSQPRSPAEARDELEDARPMKAASAAAAASSAEVDQYVGQLSMVGWVGAGIVVGGVGAVLLGGRAAGVLLGSSVGGLAGYAVGRMQS